MGVEGQREADEGVEGYMLTKYVCAYVLWVVRAWMYEYDGTAQEKRNRNKRWQLISTLFSFLFIYLALIAIKY